MKEKEEWAQVSLSLNKGSKKLRKLYLMNPFLSEVGGMKSAETEEGEC